MRISQPRVELFNHQSPYFRHRYLIWFPSRPSRLRRLGLDAAGGRDRFGQAGASRTPRPPAKPFPRAASPPRASAGSRTAGQVLLPSPPARRRRERSISTTCWSSRTLPRQGCARAARGRRPTGRVPACRGARRSAPGSAGPARRHVVRPARAAAGSERDRVDPVEEVLAERSRPRPAPQVFVRRRDEAEVHGDRPPAAHALDLARLERAQELRLDRQRQRADLVEKERPALGQLEPPGPRRDRRPVNAPFSWPKSSASASDFRQRRGVDGDERPGRRRGLPAWIACATSSLPVPLSPRISTVASLRRDLRDVAEEAAHRRRSVPTIRLEPAVGRAAWRSSRFSDEQPPPLERAAQDQQELGRVDRLLEEVERAERDRPERMLPLCLPRHHHDRRVGIACRAPRGAPAPPRPVRRAAAACRRG